MRSRTEKNGNFAQSVRKHQIDRDEASCRMNLITNEQPDLFSEKL